MKLTEEEKEDLPFEYMDLESVMCKCHSDIMDAIKSLLASGNYREEFCYYINVSTPNDNGERADHFYSPLISVGLIEGYGLYYLQYQVNLNTKIYVDPSDLTALIRCIYNHTSRFNTARDIEQYIEVHNEKWHSYESALSAYRSGNIQYQPIKIEKTMEEA